jgi:hypothetical protein
VKAKKMVGEGRIGGKQRKELGQVGEKRMGRHILTVTAKIS